ncbi:MAG TPA: tetratricopeptide repeat protein, partial [Chitinophagales bacterium]
MNRALRPVSLYQVFILFVAFGIAGCGTTNQAPIMQQAYSDLTSRDNAFFNAREQMKEILKTADKSHKDDFSQVISVYSYSDPRETSGASSELDAMEKRCTKSLQVHNFSNYADDHFLLLGEASYLKGDYEKAAQNFKFVTTEYKEGVDFVKEMKRLKGKTVNPSKHKADVKKPEFEKVENAKGKMVLKKIDNRPSIKFWIHHPARSEALVWLTKTYTAQEKYTEADAIINYAKNDDAFYKDFDKDLLLAEADLNIKREDWVQAARSLDAYLKMVPKGKKKRLRPLFALAQIAERLHKYDRAVEFYKEVLKSNPNYDMEFYAKLQQIRIGRKGNSNVSELKQLLAKMLHDGRYRDNYDQLYYELGGIALEEKDRDLARNDFHKSVDVSTVDATQKSRSFLKLAQMDYEDEAYRPAKFNYDSAIGGMKSTDSLYQTSLFRSKVLASLVTQLDIITTQDSLQRIAKMTTGERMKFIKKLLAEQEKAREKEEQAKQAATMTNTAQGANVGGGASAWYFYNVEQRTKGYADFVKKWGKRKWEPNWRRKDKTSSSSDMTADDTTTDSTKTVQDTVEDTSSEIDKALAGLPLTPEKMKESNEKLVNAYYASGVIYKDDLENHTKAAKQFETLISKYPKSKLDAESYYQLYLLALKSKSHNPDTYKLKILEEYPNSDMAKYLRDPNYFAKLEDQKNALNKYYESAFNDYSNGYFSSATEKCRMASVKFNSNPLQPKFDLLNALVFGKQHRVDEYVQALHQVIEKYPNTDEQKKAQDLLGRINGSSYSLQQVASKEAPKEAEPIAQKIPEKPQDASTNAATNTEKTVQQEPIAQTNTQLETNKSTNPINGMQPMALNKAGIGNLKSALSGKLGKLAGNNSAPPNSAGTADNSASQPTQQTSDSQTATQTQPNDVPQTTTENNASSNTITETPTNTDVTPPTDTIVATQTDIEKTVTNDEKTTSPEGSNSEVESTITAITEETTIPAKPPVIMTIKFDSADHADGVYGRSETAPHQVVIIFKNAMDFSNAILPKLDSFEKKQYDLPIWVNRFVDVDANTKMITIKPFKNKDEALAFIAKLEGNFNEAIGKDREKVLLYAISSLNYCLAGFGL